MAEDLRSEHVGQMDHSRFGRQELRPAGVSRAAAVSLDLSECRQAERELIAAKEYAESIVETVHEPLIVLTPELIVKSVNAAFYHYFQVCPEETLGRRIYDLGNRQWNIPALRRLLEEILPVNRVFNDYEVRHDFESIGPRVMLLNARQLDHAPLILLGIRDITEHKAAEEALRVKDSAIASSLNAVAIADLQGRLTYVNPAFLRLWRYGDEREVLGRSTLDFWEQPQQASEVMRAIRNGESWEGELVAVTKDGTHRNLHLSASTVRNDDGTPICMMGSFVDITERKRLEEQERRRSQEALERSEEQYRSLFENMPGGYSYCRMLYEEGIPRDFVYLTVNRAFETITGLQGVVGKKVSEVIPGIQTSNPELFEIYGRVARTGQPKEFETYVECLKIWFAVSVYSPQAEYFVALFEDITERKRAEETLASTNERLRAQTQNLAAANEELLTQKEALQQQTRELHKLKDHADQMAHLVQESPDPAMRVWADGRIWYRNPASFRLCRRWNTDDEERVPLAVREIVSAAHTRETIVRREVAFGELIYLLTVAPVPGVGYVNLYAQDITDRKLAELALRKQAALIDLSPDAIMVRSVEGTITFWSRGAESLYGWTSQQALGQQSHSLLNTQSRQPLPQILDEVQKTGSWSGELIHLTKDGRQVIVQSRWQFTSDDGSGHREILESNVDITERKQVEQTLRASEERLALAASATRIGMYEWDVATGEALWTEQVARLLGLRTTTTTTTIPRRYHYRDWAKRVHPEDWPRVQAELRRCMVEGASYEIEYRAIWPDGSEHWLATRGVLQYDPEGRPTRLLGIVMDIEERKQWEISLRQTNQALVLRTRQLQKAMLDLSQAEESERQRLAEILHDDLQQQLAAAKFHLGLLGKQVQEDASLREAVDYAVELLKDAIEKSRSLSRELSPLSLYHGDFGEVLEWLAGQMLAKHGLAVHVQARGEVTVSSDSIKTLLFRAAQEILFNIVKHAGVVEATVRLRRRDGWLWMGLWDRGRGFNPRALQPTAGFGLASIRERIELLGGRMKIRSTPGRGSTFLIAVPDPVEQDNSLGAGPRAYPMSAAVDGHWEQENGPGEQEGGHREPPLRVLLVDDHEIMRRALAVLLSREKDVEVVGHAAQGRQAVDLALELQPDVVLMDLSMPVMDGDEATRQIKEHLPRTRVIALSMYDELEKRQRMFRAGAQEYVLKSAEPENLLAAIRGKVPVR